jgi:hypothetical protein
VPAIRGVRRLEQGIAARRSQLDRVLDPENVSARLDTLMKAARTVGKTVEIKIKKAPQAAT